MAKKTLLNPPKVAPGAGVTEVLHSGLLLAVSDAVNFGDSSPVTIFTVPANSYVLDIGCEIVVAFLGTSPTLSVGVGGAATRHLPTADITAGTIGFYGAAKLSPWKYTADTDIIVTIGGSALTAGQAKFYVVYRPLITENPMVK